MVFIIVTLVALVPHFIKGNNNTKSSSVTTLSILCVVFYFYSALARIPEIETIVLIIWIIAIILAVTGREKSLFFVEEED